MHIHKMEGMVNFEHRNKLAETDVFLFILSLGSYVTGILHIARNSNVKKHQVFKPWEKRKTCFSLPSQSLALIYFIL